MSGRPVRGGLGCRGSVLATGAADSLGAGGAMGLSETCLMSFTATTTRRPSAVPTVTFWLTTSSESTWPAVSSVRT